MDIKELERIRFAMTDGVIVHRRMHIDILDIAIEAKKELEHFKAEYGYKSDGAIYAEVSQKSHLNYMNRLC
jgi:predicted GNAT family N-acyltransferase